MRQLLTGPARACRRQTSEQTAAARLGFILQTTELTGNFVCALF